MQNTQSILKCQDSLKDISTYIENSSCILQCFSIWYFQTGNFLSVVSNPTTAHLINICKRHVLKAFLLFLFSVAFMQWTSFVVRIEEVEFILKVYFLRLNYLISIDLKIVCLGTIINFIARYLVYYNTIYKNTIT